MPRTPIAVGLVVLAVLSSAAVATAQPVVEVQAGVQAPIAPQPQMMAQPMQPQPMRYVLTNGTAIIGTEVGGDAEWVMIQTPNGVMQVRRVEIASMDYQTGQVGVVVAPQPQTPPPGYMVSPPPRRRGRGLIIAGSIVFGISYGLPALIGVSSSSPSALWFLMPVVGPILWANNTDCSGDFADGCRTLAVTLGAFLTAIQAAGAVMLVVGLSMRSGDDAQAEAELRFADATPRLRLEPVLAPGYQGLSLHTEF